MSYRDAFTEAMPSEEVPVRSRNIDDILTELQKVNSSIVDLLQKREELIQRYNEQQASINERAYHEVSGFIEYLENVRKTNSENIAAKVAL